MDATMSAPNANEAIPAPAAASDYGEQHHRPLRILSFNVNGLKACLQRLYGPTATISRFLQDVGRDADIVCLQETKIPWSGELNDSLATADGWDAFFACCADRAYSGVATFCRKSTVLPFNAEIGFTTLAPMFPAATAAAAAANQAPPPELQQFASEDELRNLDSEGRVVVTDHGAFVLFNIYGPAITSDDPEQAAARLSFKMRFFGALQRRWQALRAAGRAVVVVGDLNIAPQPIDTPDDEDEDNTKSIEFYSSVRPHRAWLKGLLSTQQGTAAAVDVDSISAISNSLQFVDCFRAFHSYRRNAYTCWSTLTNARALNFGSRIDLCLTSGLAIRNRPSPPPPAAQEAAVTQGGGRGEFSISEGELHKYCVWVAGSDIWPEQQGSDHCPVWVDIGYQGKFPCAEVSPKTAIRFAFSGKQTTLKPFFMPVRVDTDITSRSGEQAVESQQQQQQMTAAVSGNRSTTSGGAVAKNGKKANSSSTGTVKQPSVASFFKKKTTTSVATVDAAALPSAAAAAQGEEEEDIGCASAAATSQPPPQQRQPSLLMQAELEAAASLKEKDLSEAKIAWQAIQKRMVMPKCKHGEPCVRKQVTKQGPNKGRWFFTCGRPVGKGPKAQCNCFQWVEKRSGDYNAGGGGQGGGAKRLKTT